MKIETIKASEAPAAPKKLAAETAEVLAALSALKKDEVLKVTPTEGKDVRGVKVSIGRIAKGGGFKLTSYDEGGIVYFKKEG